MPTPAPDVVTYWGSLAYAKLAPRDAHPAISEAQAIGIYHEVAAPPESAPAPTVYLGLYTHLTPPTGDSLRRTVDHSRFTYAQIGSQPKLKDRYATAGPVLQQNRTGDRLERNVTVVSTSCALRLEPKGL